MLAGANTFQMNFCCGTRDAARLQHLEAVDTLVFDVHPDGVRHQLRRSFSVQDVVDQQPDGRHHGGRHQEVQVLSSINAGGKVLTLKKHHLPFRQHLRGRSSEAISNYGNRGSNVCDRLLTK